MELSISIKKGMIAIIKKSRIMKFRTSLFRVVNNCNLDAAELEFIIPDQFWYTGINEKFQDNLVLHLFHLAGGTNSD